MSAKVPQLIVKSLLLIVLVSLAVTNARPSHFGDSNQGLSGDQESNNILDTGLKPWQLALVQKLSEMSQIGEDYGLEKALRSPEAKRQSRYRQCYFNPISCFRK